jgi:hypothetical protein
MGVYIDYKEKDNLIVEVTSVLEGLVISNNGREKIRR